MEKRVNKMAFNKLKNISPQAITSASSALVKMQFLEAEQPMPLVVTPLAEDVDLSAWIGNNQETLRTKLSEHGALLFRGFRIISIEEFEKSAQALCPELFGEYGDLPRAGVGGNVYMSTPYPADKAILFHNESSHLNSWPMKQWFFCVQPSQEGGETPIVDSRLIYRRLAPEIRERFEQKQLLYVRNFIPGLDVSWQDFFRTTDKTVVEDYCQKANIVCEWKGQDHLRTSQVRSAVARHPLTQEKVFFNQIPLHHFSCLEASVQESLLALFGKENLPRHVYYGDGSPIEDSLVAEIVNLYWENTISFPWQQYDILMIDNMLVAHARKPFAGARKIVVAMGEMFSRQDLPQV